ncbi:unnamed protein product, partial [Tenebrio molitor]
FREHGQLRLPRSALCPSVQALKGKIPERGTDFFGVSGEQSGAIFQKEKKINCVMVGPHATPSRAVCRQ